MPNTPDAIPAEYASNETLADAYKRGWDHGHDIACHNVPSLGDKIDRSIDYVGIGSTVDAENIREYHELLCHAAADNSRSYSPFEFTAHEFNEYGDGSQYSIETADPEGNGRIVYFVADESLDDVADEDFETREAAQAWIDARPSSEELWEAFEAGTVAAIHADLATYTDADYEIEAETVE